MGSKKSVTAELIGRCQAVGWEVKMSGSGHWRVKTHRGRVFSIASSTGDIHGLKNAERTAVRHGLADLERKLELRQAKERLERLKEDRAQGVNWEEEEQKINNDSEDAYPFGYVNGIGIVEKVPARAGHPRNPNKTIDIQHGMELLMGDGTVIFECVHPVMLNHVYQDCGRQFETANSLRAHISWHSRTVPTSPTVDTETEARPGPTNEEVIADRTPRYVSTASDIEKLKEVEVMESKPKPGLVAELIDLGQYAEVLYDEVGRIGDELDTIREGISRLRDDIRKATERIALENVDVDELREKAARYDQILKIAK
jgi:hypothetical protein